MGEFPVARTPPPIKFHLWRPARKLWLDRAKQVGFDSYAGAPLMKMPEDLRVYEHLLWLARPNVVIELGSYGGGSALWFRDRLLVLERYGRISSGPKVVSVDADTERAVYYLDRADPKWSERITLLKGDVRDPGLVGAVREQLQADARCMVIEDTEHEYETTLAALKGFAPFVAPESFYVAEDSSVDVRAMRMTRDWPRGVLLAVREWLASEAGSDFRVRRDLELYGLSANPAGYLERVR